MVENMSVKLQRVIETETTWKLLLNHVYVGIIYQEVDGKYVFWSKNIGYFDAYSLKKIANILESFTQEAREDNRNGEI